MRTAPSLAIASARSSVPRDLERAHEVLAGAAREDRELHLAARARAHEAVDGLEDGAVAAHRDDQPRAVAGRLRGQVGDLPGRVLMSVSPSSPAAAARRAISGQRRPVEPFADAGLTTKTTPSRVTGR